MKKIVHGKKILHPAFTVLKLNAKMSWDLCVNIPYTQNMSLAVT